MKQKRVFFLLVLFVILFRSEPTLAQGIQNSGMTDREDSTELGKVKIGGYIDTYYAYDFNQPKDGNRPYAVSSSRTQEININLAYLDIRYQTNHIRARLAPGFGTYVNANYASEPSTLKNMIEAYGGVKLSTTKNIWLDAGVMGSPFTNESAISKDHLMYSRSLAAEYVPYYLSGLRLTAPLTKRLNAYIYLVNGWQRINNPNQKLSIATQIEHKVSDKILINWNVFYGNESSKIDSNYGKRFFTDVYAIINPNGKLSFTSCVYMGMQQHANFNGLLNNSSNKQTTNWYQGNIIARYSINKKLSLSGRVEFFSDPNLVMLRNENTARATLGLPKGTTQLNSYGFCLNFKLSQNALFRLEHRHYMSDDPFVSTNGLPVHTEDVLFGNLTVWF
ncbi:MAG: outer membrane beta-barrel protein [bacterium]|nr:outer membrane beta-barrel protein [bacterium]